MKTPENEVPEEMPRAEAEQEPAAQPAVLPAQAAASAETPAVREWPEDLRATWSWADVGIFALFGFGSLLVLTNVLAQVAADIWRMSPQEMVKFVASNAGFVALRQTLWFGVLLGYLYVVLRVRRSPDASGRIAGFWRTIGWRALRIGALPKPSAALLCMLGGIVLAVAVQFASAVIGKPPNLPIEALFQDRRSVLLVMSVGVLLAPLVEETVFRGFIYPVAARTLGVPLGVVCTGVMFGLMHAPQLWGGWGQVALLIFVGIVLTYVRARTGTVAAAYFMHFGYNAILFVAFFFATGGLRYFPNQ